MKIYIVDNNIDEMGGVERILSTIANRLSKEHYDVNVISIYKTKNTPFFEYDTTIKRNYFVEIMNCNKVIHKPNRFTIKRKIKELCKEIQEDDIVIFGRVEVSIRFLPYLKNNNVIVRDAIHYFHYNYKIRALMKKYFNKKVKLFIVSSDESMKVYNEKLKLNNMKKIYNPLGIIPKVNYNSDCKKIVAVGRYDSQKGFENLIKACNIVLKNKQDWNLEIVGVGNKSGLLEQYIENDIRNRVILNSGEKDIVSKLNEAGIFIMTSRYEGYANALVEAMACGVPPISYDWLLGADDIINDGENGSIVKLKDRFAYARGKDCEEDINSLAKQIEYLIENEELREKYSLEAAKITESRNPENIIEIWKSEIENVIRSEK